MNLFSIIDEIEKVDPDFQDRISPRRAAIKNITSFGSKVAVAAMPFALGTLFKKAYGAPSISATSVTDVLNFALTLEYLESSFYNKGAISAGLIPASDLNTYFNTIARDENAHVTFLQTVIKSLGGTPVDEASLQFDFTGGNGSNAGPFVTVFTSYSTFLAVAQAFEDTGVRAYKGQAPNLLGNQVVLTAALGIHAVEARHASTIRLVRGVTPWITSTASVGNDTGIPLVNGNYDGEQNVMQGGVDTTTLPSIESSSSTSVAVATASFDEPLSMTQVLALVKGSFIVG
jgi:rubrerythrin